MIQEEKGNVDYKRSKPRPSDHVHNRFVAQTAEGECQGPETFEYCDDENVEAGTHGNKTDVFGNSAVLMFLNL